MSGSGGQPLAQARSRIAYVPQRETVDWDFPVTVMDVVRMGATSKLGWFQRGGKRERELALRSLDRVGLADFSSRQIGKLSGGAAAASLFSSSACPRGGHLFT